MFNLYDAFSVVENKEEFEKLLYDLLTEKEIKELNDRFIMAQLLENNITQREIAKQLKCSITTVTRVAKFLNGKNCGYKTILNKLKISNTKAIHHR